MTIPASVVVADRWAVVPAPVGPLVLTGTPDALTGCWFDEVPGHGEAQRAGLRRDDAAFAGVAEQLQAYFAGELTTFDVVLDPTGTEFQHRVWAELRAIPYGTTKTYGQVAAALGQPSASRAVGLANGRNPISVIVPCHRVIGSNGTLTGYAGGTENKRLLLDLEAGIVPLAG